MTSVEFERLYINHQPAPVRALFELMPGAVREATAKQLAAQGYTVDVPIMAWGWDALATMFQRQLDGYTWVPSANNALIPVGPGIHVDGMPDYDPNNPPPGSIKVSTNPADYPQSPDMVLFVSPLGQIREGSHVPGQPREGIGSKWNLRDDNENSDMYSTWENPETHNIYQKKPQYTAYGMYPLWECIKFNMPVVKDAV